MRAIWVYDQLLNTQECLAIIKYCDKHSLKKDAVVGSVGNIDPSIRNNKVAWLERSDTRFPWLFPRLDSFIFRLNRHWFDIDYDKEGCDSLQYTVYEKGEYYHQHIDTFFNLTHGIERKISCSILLSEPKDFKGGELYIEQGTMEPDKIQAGQAYVFPSIIPHNVAPVTFGSRKTLVAWYTGRSWR